MAKSFIDRPIFAIVIAILVVLAGGLSILSMPIEQYPKQHSPKPQLVSNEEQKMEYKALGNTGLLVTILAAFALLDTQDHALTIDVTDLQRDHLAGTQSCTVGDR
jgi:AcrB/AcrD/AcrF family protein